MRYFNGEIANKKLVDFNKYDNKITKVVDRISFVEDVLYEEGNLHEFFSTYFSEYYRVSPRQDDYLGEGDSVCKLLDILGTYILGANDIESHRKIEYRFWKNEREYRDYKDSENVSSSMTTNDDDCKKDVEIVDMFVNPKSDKNQKIVKSTSINKRDIKEIAEIAELEKVINNLNSSAGQKAIKERCRAVIEGGYNIEEKELARLTQIEKNTDRFVAKYIANLRENQIAIKEAIRKPFEFKNTMEIKADDKLDIAHFSDITVNKRLLPMVAKDDDLMSELGLLVYDFKVLVNKIPNFTEREKEIIGLFKEGIKQKDMSKELGIDRRTVSDIVGRIANKIAKYYVKDLYLRTKEKI